MKILEMAIQPSDIAELITMDTKIFVSFEDREDAYITDSCSFIRDCIKGKYSQYEVTEIFIKEYGWLGLRFDLLME